MAWFVWHREIAYCNFTIKMAAIYQTPSPIQIPDLDMARLMESFSDPPAIRRGQNDDIYEISRLSEIQPTNLLNEFDQVSSHLGAPSPIGPYAPDVINTIRVAYNNMVTGIESALGYSESSRYVMLTLVREIMNAPVSGDHFIVCKQDDYEPAFQDLDDRIRSGTNWNSMSTLLEFKSALYQAFQSVLNWINVDEHANDYVIEYHAIIMG